MISFLKSSKLRQPDEPASTIGGHAGSEAVVIGTHAGGTGVCRPRAGKYVNMQIHQAGRDIEPCDVHGFRGLCRRNFGRDRGDPAIFDGDVSSSADLVLWIDDVAALQQQVIFLSVNQAGANQQK